MSCAWTYDEHLPYPAVLLESAIVSERCSRTSSHLPNRTTRSSPVTSHTRTTVLITFSLRCALPRPAEMDATAQLQINVLRVRCSTTRVMTTSFRTTARGAPTLSRRFAPCATRRRVVLLHPSFPLRWVLQVNTMHFGPDDLKIYRDTKGDGPLCRSHHRTTALPQSRTHTLTRTNRTVKYKASRTRTPCITSFAASHLQLHRSRPTDSDRRNRWNRGRVCATRQSTTLRAFK